MKKLRFVWVDDQQRKVEPYRGVIEAGLDGRRASIELLEVRDDVLEVLTAWVNENKKNPPHLLVIDHVFNAALPFGLKGSSVAHLLRGAFPKVPMVCVTAMFDRPRKFDQEDISEYTALFLYQQLEDHIEDLYAIARDFGRLHAEGKNVRSHLVAALKPPPRDKDDLMGVLPEEFQAERHATTEHRMARWIFNVLMARPGFLYDTLHTATLLGLTEPGFAKIQDQFEKARYRGVFATESRPLWWLSALRNRLFELAGGDAPDLPQLAGRSLTGIVEADFSVCYMTKKPDPPPDAVVDADTTRDAKRRVVRRQYSEKHPSDPGIAAGFESRLVLKRTQK